MMRILAACLLAITLACSTSHAQFIEAGSTAEGDYLRGVGVAAAGMGQYAAGMGQYNLDTAQANSIDADTLMRVDSYIKAVRKAQNQERAQHRIERQARFNKALADIRKRLLDDPQLRDFQTGDAHNAHVEALGRFTSSEMRATPIPLSSDLVRKIPFKINEKGLTVSISRMLHRNSPWPVAFQDAQFSRERVNYDRAMSEALDQFVELKVQQLAIVKVQKAINELEVILKRRPYAGNDYHEAVAHLGDLKKYAQMLQHQMAQDVLVDLESYSGTTIADLLRFMADHKVKFDVPERPEEKAAYREIYIALAAQRSLVDGGMARPDK